MATRAELSFGVRFGEFELNAASGELRKGGILLKIHPQPFRVLLLLAERSGQIVSRAEIRRSLWGDNTYVDFDGGINFCVRQIREVLADDAENPRYLQTIPRRGYRFIASTTIIPTRQIHVVTATGGGVVVERRPEAKRLDREASEKQPSEAAAKFAAVEELKGKNWRLALLVGAAVVILAAGLGWNRWRHRASENRVAPSEIQLTANPPEDYVAIAAISPDGKYVAYVDQIALLVRSVESGEVRTVALPADFLAAQIWEVRWFPEGGKLLITRRESVSEETSLWTVAVLGQAPPQRLRKDASEPSISPDGKSIVFRSGALHQAKEIWVSGVNGEAARKIVDAAEDQGAGSPVWSPDGRWIAYQKWKRGAPTAERSIEILPSSGGASKRLVSEASLADGSTFDCEGSGFGCLNWASNWNLAFTSLKRAETAGDKETRSLWKVRVDAKTGAVANRPAVIATLGDLVTESLTTTADGKTLAFMKLRASQDVYVGELDGGLGALRHARRLTLDNHDSFPNAWMPDGRSLLIASNRNGQVELFRQGVSGGVAESILAGAGNKLGTESGLSPDGSWILYWEYVRIGDKVRPDKARLMRQPVGGGPPEMTLEEPYSEDAELSFSCAEKAGELCVMNGWDGNELVFYALGPVGGKGEELGRIEVDRHWMVGWSVSPDGSQIAVVDHRHEDRIEIYDVARRTWREIAVEPGWGDFHSVAWAPQGKGFFVDTFLPASFNLVHVTMRGKVQVLSSNARTQYMTRPRPSRDGKYLAYQAESEDGNVWLLKDF
ncbi:MAG: winged helix-turn-helix domain-containing protein [Candidatus Acidiferrum sp.]|jgi:Tol biopolymer transport system component/DNA-binding winged helix-turn-helix (wHTH) protein